MTLQFKQAGKFVEFYRKYSYLWIDDRKEQLKQFLKYGRILELDELELQGKVDDEDKPFLEERAPTLAEFKAKVICMFISTNYCLCIFKIDLIILF